MIAAYCSYSLLTKFLYIQSIEKFLNISGKDVREHEFPVFAALQFSLHPSERDVMPHFRRIIGALDYSNIQEYLGEKMFTMYFTKHAVTTRSEGIFDRTQDGTQTS